MLTVIEIKKGSIYNIHATNEKQKVIVIDHDNFVDVDDIPIVPAPVDSVAPLSDILEGIVYNNSDLSLTEVDGATYLTKI